MTCFDVIWDSSLGAFYTLYEALFCGSQLPVLHVPVASFDIVTTESR
jgi:hypothetical protein